MFVAKRVYDPPSKDDGYRVLVDRLWPRGLTKSKAHVDVWLKEVAPSTELRKWFGHEPEKWPEFQKRYRAEMKAQPQAMAALRKLEKEHKKSDAALRSEKRRAQPGSGAFEDFEKYLKDAPNWTFLR